MFDLTSRPILMTGLASAALTPGLRSILVFDAPYSELQQMAGLLAELLRVATGQRVKQYLLAAFESDDDVWGSLDLSWRAAESEGLPTHRLFSPERNAQELQLIIIPDLTALTLVAARSVTMLAGADVVHLERNGISASWHPQQCWIAACESNAVGKLSPHLLDRFSLRFSWKELVPSQSLDEEAATASLLARVPCEPIQETTTLPSTYLEQIEQAARRNVDIPPVELARVLDYLPAGPSYPRREITLARFAVALAQLSGASSLSNEHVDRAAGLLGFTRGLLIAEEASRTEETPPPVEGEDEMREEQSPPLNETAAAVSSLSQELTQPIRAQVPETIHTALVESETLCGEPYPEDGALKEREETTLKLPPLRYARGHLARGAIIGTEETDSLYDLAPVSTILAALKFQKIRQDVYQQQHGEPYPGLLIERMDLRRYRRSRPLEQVFLLLFDYTSIRENKYWEEALLPYVRAAYVARAGVIIVKVGAADALSPLRAEVVSAKNILGQRVSRAFATGAGQATPLAHGLSLALEHLQRVLQHGRETAQKVTFVVVSDGRGNVPLSASIREEKRRIVTREGIDDALKEARKIRTLKHVEVTVLDPLPAYYVDLPERLAEALGGNIVPISVSQPEHALEVRT